MKKELYRVFYYTVEEHRGETYYSIEKKTIVDTIENIKKKYNIYYLTDSCGNVIIDNR